MGLPGAGMPGAWRLDRRNNPSKIFAGCREWFDTRVGLSFTSGEVAGLRGQRLGINQQSAAASNRLIYSASDATMNNLPTVTSDKSVPRYLRANGHGTLLALPSGSFPAVLQVSRISDATPGNGQRGVQLTASSNVTQLQVVSHNATFLTKAQYFLLPTSVQVDVFAGVSTANVYSTMLAWHDGSIIHYELNGNDQVSAAAQPGINVAAANIAMGAGNAGTTAGTWKWVQIVIAASVTAAEITAYKAYLASADFLNWQTGY